MKIWNDNSTNTGMFDRFSLAHMGAGVWLGAAGMGIVPILIYHTAFEILENTILKEKFNIFPDSSKDTFPNMIGDTLAMVVGWSFNLKDRIEDPIIGNWGLSSLWTMEGK